jgi:hypothetical protein
MSSVVGIFEDERGVSAARELLIGSGYPDSGLALLRPPGDRDYRRTILRHRGEVMLRAAVRWGIIGALMVEIPSLIIVLMLPVDINVKVFMGATMWKFGAGFGSWIGAIAAGERGLDEEIADEYESRLEHGFYVLGADVRRRDRPFARGAMLESGAIEARDVVGTFEVKVPKRERAHS